MSEISVVALLFPTFYGSLAAKRHALFLCYVLWLKFISLISPSATDKGQGQKVWRT